MDKYLIQRDSSGRFASGGSSPNPGGRPRGIGAYVKEMTSDGEQLVDMFVQVARGDHEDLPSRGAARLKLRMAAAQYLLDRAYGKAPTISLEATVQEEIRIPIQLVDEILKSANATSEGPTRYQLPGH